MEGNSNWNPNYEQSILNNANDWRSQHEPDLRFNVVADLVIRLKTLCPDLSIDQIEETVFKIEENIYGTAIDKDDYERRIMQRKIMIERRCRSVQAGSLVQRTNTLEPAVAPAQVLNQGQSVRTSLPYTQTPTTKQWLRQDIQSNSNVRASFLPHSQVQMQGRQELVPQQRLNYETIRHGNLRPPHMQQHAKQPQQQQLSHPTFFGSIQPPFARFPVVSGQQNSQILPRPHISTLMATVSQLEQQLEEHKKLMTQMRNALHGSSLLGTQQLRPQNRSLQHHLDESQWFQTTCSLWQNQNRVDQQNQPYPLQRVTPANTSTSQDSTTSVEWQEETYQKIQALKEMSVPFLSTYLQKYVEKLQEIDSLPRQKGIHKEIESLRKGKWALEQTIELLNVHRTRVSESHREKLGMLEEQLLKWARSKRESHSLQTRCKMKSKDENKNIMASSGNVLLPSLKQNPEVEQSDINLVQSDMFQQKQLDHWSMQQSEANQQLQMPTSHETNEMNDVRMRQENHIRTGLLQQHLSSSHHQLPTPLPSPAQLVDQEILPAIVNETGSPTQSGGSSFLNLSPLTYFDTFPDLGDPENTMYSVSLSYQFQTAADQSPPCQPNQEHPAFTLLPHVQIAEDSIDRMIRAVQPSSQESLEESENEMRSAINLADRIPRSVQSRACLAEDLTDTRRGLTTHDEPNQSKRMKRSITSQTDDKHFSGLEPEANSTPASGSKVNKTNAKDL